MISQRASYALQRTPVFAVQLWSGGITRTIRGGILGAALFGAVTFGADPKVPDTFLPAPPVLMKVLQTPVSGTFRDASPKEVIAALCRQLPANLIYAHDVGKPAPPNFTGTFKNTPLRTALYRVAQATHIHGELLDRGDGSKVLKFWE